MSTSLGNVGDVRRAAGDREGALKAYQESLDIRRKLVAADPNNTEWLRDVSTSLISVGDVQLSAGDREDALEAYDEASRSAASLPPPIPATPRGSAT